MCWVDFKSATLCSSLFETGVPYTIHITGVDNSFNKKSRYLAGPFCGKDAKFHQIERDRKRIKWKKVKWGTPHRYRFSRRKFFRFILFFVKKCIVCNLLLILMMYNIYIFGYFNILFSFPKNYVSVRNKISFCYEWFRKYISRITEQGGTKDTYSEYPLRQYRISVVHICLQLL